MMGRRDRLMQRPLRRLRSKRRRRCCPSLTSWTSIGLPFATASTSRGCGVVWRRPFRGWRTCSTRPPGPGCCSTRIAPFMAIEQFTSLSYQMKITLWFIGDLHGDLLALEAALLLIRSHAQMVPRRARIVFLGDFFDDEGFGLEVLLRVFEIILENPALVCIVAGNHDEALGHDGTQFTSSVSPSDFSRLPEQQSRR